MNARKLTALAGAGFVALFALAFVVGGSTPDPHAGPATVASYYNAHNARAIVAAFSLAAAVPFLVIFAVTLAVVYWRADAEERPIWALVLVAGGAMTGAGMLVGATVHFALADGAAHISGQALQALNVVDGDIWMAFNPALGVMMLGAAGVLLTHTAGRRILGWSALALGVALFVPFVDFFALLASGIWIVTESIALSRAPGAARYAAAPSPIATN
jgi:hypothetical protein